MMDVKHCVGCRDNFYNGNNTLGVNQCWRLEDALVIPRRRVRMDERPPWTAAPEPLPQCYHASGYIFVHPTQTK